MRLTVLAAVTLLAAAARGQDTFQDARRAWADGRHAEAARLARPLADEGHAGALNLLGVLHERGEGVERDREIAVDFFRRAAKKGHAEAQYNLARQYRPGGALEESAGQALKWLIESAHRGFGIAQYELALHYRDGRGLERDEAEAARWMERAARREIPRARLEHGKRLFALKAPTAHRNGAAWIMLSITDRFRDGEAFLHVRAARDPAVAVQLAFLYRFGSVVPQDKARARRLLEDARGDPEAAAHLAYYYAVGMAGEKNDVLAEKLAGFARGRDRRLGVYADCLVGFGKRRTTGVVRALDGILPYVHAQILLAQLAHQGLDDATLSMSREQIMGRFFGLVDRVKRLESLKEKSAEATFLLGLAYADGRGVERDRALGRLHLSTASRGGFLPADAKLAQLNFAEGRYRAAAIRYAALTGPPDEAERKYAAYGEFLPRRTIERLDARATDGDPAATTTTAYLFLQLGHPERALAIIRPLAIETRYVPAFVCYGRMLRDGNGVAASPKEAAEWFREAARRGDVEGLAETGRCLAEGLGVAKDPAAATDMLRLAVQHHYEDAKKVLRELGRSYPPAAYESGRFESNRERAAEEIAGAATRGYAPAVEWLDAESRKGNAAAQLQLARLCFVGRNVERNLPRARTLLEAAVRGGNLEAHIDLAEFLVLQHRTTRDEDTWARAMELLKHAAQQKDRLAKRAMGKLAWHHQHAGQHTDAVRWARAGASRGDMLAHRVLAANLVSGRVIRQDLVEAAAILKALAAARFESELDRQAADIEKDLTPEQRAQVAARAEKIRTHFRR